MNIDKEKAKRFLDMINEAGVRLEIEHNSYDEAREDMDDDYDAEEAWCAEECGLTTDEVQYIFDNLEQYQ